MEVQNYLLKGKLIFPQTLNDKTKGYDKDTRECYRLSLKFEKSKNEDDISNIAIYYDPKDRFTPKWVKKFLEDATTPEYINFKSNYPLIVKERKDGKDIELDRSRVISGATGWLAVTLKSEDDVISLYPSQFLMLENGALSNPFDDLDL